MREAQANIFIQNKNWVMKKMLIHACNRVRGAKAIIIKRKITKRIHQGSKIETTPRHMETTMSFRAWLMDAGPLIERYTRQWRNNFTAPTGCIQALSPSHFSSPIHPFNSYVSPVEFWPPWNATAEKAFTYSHFLFQDSILVVARSHCGPIFLLLNDKLGPSNLSNLGLHIGPIIGSTCHVHTPPLGKPAPPCEDHSFCFENICTRKLAHEVSIRLHFQAEESISYITINAFFGFWYCLYSLAP